MLTTYENKNLIKQVQLLSHRTVQRLKLETYGALAQLARAPPLQGGGQGFEFLRLHHNVRRS